MRRRRAGPLEWAIGALARCCAALGGHADLVLEKVVVEVAVEAAVEGGTCR